MLLEDKTAVVYGAAGRIGGAAARGFAAEGARVFLAGRTQATVDAVAGDISQAGGTVEAAQLDALDKDAVDAHADAVVAETGRIDVSFNGVSPTIRTAGRSGRCRLRISRGRSRSR